MKVMVTFFSLAVIVLFLVLGMRSGKDRKIALLTAILFALIPIWLQSSIIILDYSASIFFAVAVGALLEFFPFAKLRSASVVSIAAGMLLGIGIGSRITTALLLPAIIAGVLFDKRKNFGIKAVFISGLTISTTAVAMLLYKPAFDRYGIGFLNTTHIPMSLSATFKFVMYQLINLSGGLAGGLALMGLAVIAVRNMKSRLFDRMWVQQGIGRRALLLFAFFNTLCYLLNPEKVAYFLPLLIGLMLLLIIGLEWRDRFILTGAMLVMAVGSFVQLSPRGFHGMEVRRGQVLNEWRHQHMDRSLFESFQSLIKEPHNATLLIGYPATDRMVVWFYDSTRVVETLPHPFARTLWRTRTFYPDKVYEINGLLLADPPLLQSASTLARLETIVASRGIHDVRLVRSWLKEPVEIPASLCNGKSYRELSY